MTAGVPNIKLGFIRREPRTSERKRGKRGPDRKPRKPGSGRKPEAICGAGHAKVGKNLYVDPRGRHVCRECARNAFREWYGRQPAARARKERDA